MAHKHYINDPTQLVNLALRAAPSTNPALALDETNKVVFRKSAPKQVALVSGGGAGHEPSFVGYVGNGVLRAAVSGTIFASPSVKQIYNCICQRVNPNTGVLLIVMNYTGDVLHFGLATEKARAKGLSVEMVVIGDDVGVGRAKSGKVGRRGIAGTVLVHKIVGALAATGASLKDTASLARLVSANLVSMGSSLAHVHIPGTAMGETDAGLKTTEIELGMGIHNEQGSKTMEMPPLSKLVDILLQNILGTGDNDRNYLDPAEESDGWVLMVNNLGGVSPLEFSGITTEVVQQLLDRWSINPKRVYSGTYMTSLNGNGFSITLLKLVDTGLGAGRSMVELLDSPHETTGWNAAISPATWRTADRRDFVSLEDEDDPIQKGNLKMNEENFVKALSGGLEKVISCEAEITKYDQIVGDGDCGTGLRRGAVAVLEYINSGNITNDVVTTLAKIADLVEDHMDGTSGALYSIFLNALVKALRDSKSEQTDVSTWAEAARYALSGLGRYTPAQPGDRTLVDALHPFVTNLAETNDLVVAARAARAGAEKTKRMEAKLGRTVYIESVGAVPDPGAVGIAVFAEGMAGL